MTTPPASSEPIEQQSTDLKAIFRLIAPIVLGVILWLLPAPEGLDSQGWHMLVIFFSTLLGVMVSPLPMSAVTLMGVAALCLTKTLTLKQALAGYGDPVTWLVVMAFFISHGFIKTGLGLRIAYGFMRLLGKKTLTLGYGLTLTDTLLAPAMPSTTARAGAVVFPIMQSIATIYDSKPGATAKRMGAYLIMVVFHANAITSTMFLTGMAGNPLVVKLAATQGVELSWLSWALGALLPGLVCLILMPLCLYWLISPELKETPRAVSMAKEELQRLGPLSKDEWIMMGTFLSLLVLWIFGQQLGFPSTLVAMVGVCILLLSGVLDWDDLRGNKGAWDTMIWFGAFITMAHYLSAYGVVGYVSEQVGILFGDLPAGVTMVAICTLYYFFHYFFAASTAQISAMYASFLLIMLSAGVPPMGGALMLAYTSNICAVITHYGNGPAPILFGAGYVPLLSWWKTGLLMTPVYLIVWLGLGSAWMSWLGYF